MSQICRVSTYLYQPGLFTNFYVPYWAYHIFGNAKFAYGGSIFGSSQFALLLQLPLKTTLNLKVDKIDSEKIFLLD